MRDIEQYRQWIPLMKQCFESYPEESALRRVLEKGRDGFLDFLCDDVAEVVRFLPPDSFPRELNVVFDEGVPASALLPFLDEVRDRLRRGPVSDLKGVVDTLMRSASLGGGARVFWLHDK